MSPWNTNSQSWVVCRLLPVPNVERNPTGSAAVSLQPSPSQLIRFGYSVALMVVSQDSRITAVKEAGRLTIERSEQGSVRGAKPRLTCCQAEGV
jgi:hypothetical protein